PRGGGRAGLPAPRLHAVDLARAAPSLAALVAAARRPPRRPGPGRLDRPALPPSGAAGVGALAGGPGDRDRRGAACALALAGGAPAVRPCPSFQRAPPPRPRP